MGSVRRLAAILAADVAGYSRLMGVDEEGTHERLKAHLAKLVNPKIAEHRGRIVKNTGDGMLVEFPSVVDAVRCAVAIQGEMAGRNADKPSIAVLPFQNTMQTCSAALPTCWVISARTSMPPSH